MWTNFNKIFFIDLIIWNNINKSSTFINFSIGEEFFEAEKL